MKSIRVSLFFVLTGVALACGPDNTGSSFRVGDRSLEQFRAEATECYDRQSQSYAMVVDTHNHFRPFGGDSIPVTELREYFLDTGVLFTTIYGIGQTLPADSGCTYYLDCPGTPVTPNTDNDIANAEDLLEFSPSDLHWTLSMTFPDVARPEGIVDQMEELDSNYPGLFEWMGEVNLVKQALFNNGHEATPLETISEWQEFMARLRSRTMPMAIHSDLGNDAEPFKYLPLMEEVLSLYPDNDIIWVHMGLSKELTTVDAETHIAVLERLLNAYPNLMLDIAWRVLHDNYFDDLETRSAYVQFFNDFSTRILTGTDFVASSDKDINVYREEVEVNSRIHRYLNDEAFRNIALGENYFRLLGLDSYRAPDLCER